jgi:hypothetical protein
MMSPPDATFILFSSPPSSASWAAAIWRRPPKVAIDSQVVGKTASRADLMAEVDPGAHRISGPGSESDRGVVVVTMPDSSYFSTIAAWPVEPLTTPP